MNSGIDGFFCFKTKTEIFNAYNNVVDFYFIKNKKNSFIILLKKLIF